MISFLERDIDKVEALYVRKKKACTKEQSAKYEDIIKRAKELCMASPLEDFVLEKKAEGDKFFVEYDDKASVEEKKRSIDEINREVEEKKRGGMDEVKQYMEKLRNILNEMEAMMGEEEEEGSEPERSASSAFANARIITRGVKIDGKTLSHKGANEINRKGIFTSIVRDAIYGKDMPEELPQFIQRKGKGYVFKDEMAHKLCPLPTPPSSLIERQSPKLYGTGNEAGALGIEHIGVEPILRPTPIMSRIPGVNMMKLNNRAVLSIASSPTAITGYVQEAQNAPVDALTYTGLQFTPHRIHAQITTTTEFFEAGYNFEEYIKKEISARLTQSIDHQIFNALTPVDGSDLGLLVDSGAEIVSSGTNGGALTLARIRTLKGTVLNENINASNGFFVMNPLVKEIILGLSSSANTGGNIITYNSDGITGLVDGHGYLTSSIIPNNLTKGSGTNLTALCFFSPELYYFCTFGEMKIQINPFSNMSSGQIEIHASLYMDAKMSRIGTFGVIKDIITS